MKKERFIWERESKKGTCLRVVIRKNGKAKTFGTFYLKDYPKPSVAMEAARQCRDKALLDLKLHPNLMDAQMTVDEAYQASKDLFLDSVKTCERHDVLYKQIVPEAIRKTELTQISTAQIQKAVNAFAKTHTLEQTKHAFVIWKQIYSAAIMNEIPVVDRSRMIRMPKSKVVTKGHAKTCTSADLEIFLDAMLEYNAGTESGRKKSKDVWCAIRVMQYLGLRPQEAFALCRSDVDLIGDTVTIRHSIGSTKEEKRVLITTKTAESVGVLPIPAQLKPILKGMVDNSEGDLLLVASDGKPYDTSLVSAYMHNVSKKDGVPKVNLYMMRHNFSTDMLKATNNNVKLVQSMMRHASATMTLSYASTSSQEEMQEALNSRKLS